MDPSRAPRSLPLRLAGGRGAGGESEGAAGAIYSDDKGLFDISQFNGKTTFSFGIQHYGLRNFCIFRPTGNH